MRFPVSGEVVFDSALADQAWLDGIRKQCAKSAFLPPQLTVAGGDVVLYQPTITGSAAQSAFFGTIEKTAAGTRIRGRFRILRGYSILMGGAALVGLFMSFVIGWGQLSEMRAGTRPWVMDDAVVDAVMPLLVGAGEFLFWKLLRFLDAANRKKVSALIEAASGKPPST